MQDKLEQFHTLLAQHQATGRHRYPRTLRALGLELIEHMLESGFERCQIVKALGVPDSTVTYWCDNHRSDHQIVPVVIETAPVRINSGQALSLTSPSGYRIDGLELAQAIELMRALT